MKIEMKNNLLRKIYYAFCVLIYSVAGVNVVISPETVPDWIIVFLGVSWIILAIVFLIEFINLTFFQHVSKSVEVTIEVETGTKEELLGDSEETT